MDNNNQQQPGQQLPPPAPQQPEQMPPPQQQPVQPVGYPPQPQPPVQPMVGRPRRGGKIILFLIIILVLAAAGAGGWMYYKNSKKSAEEGKEQVDLSKLNANSVDPVERGQLFSNGNCEGTGSKKLGSTPMKKDDLSLILPYGRMTGHYVTPADFQYYWGKVQFGAPDMYEVRAPGGGKIVDIQYRDRALEGTRVKGDYRVVIAYSCTFLSYYDLVTSLNSDIQSQLPANWEKDKGHVVTAIPVNEGQVIGKIGAQPLHFGVWDTTKQLKNLLVPIAYNNREPWKMNTVNPLDYFTDDAKKEVEPLYVRKADPRDGIIDQDIESRAVGNWFLEDTNGYAGKFGNEGGKSYWLGHLSLARDYLDPDGWIFSIGDLLGSPQQFAIKEPSVTPDEVRTTTKTVKYSLHEWRQVDENGALYLGTSVPKSVKTAYGDFKGTLLVQLLESRKLKIEVFLGKTPEEVTDFSETASLYTRGDGATLTKP